MNLTPTEIDRLIIFNARNSPGAIRGSALV